MLSAYIWKEKTRRKEEGNKEIGERRGQRNIEKIGA